MSGRPLKILQLTDIHLLDDPGGDLRGVNTQRSFDAVLEHCLSRHRDSELVVATGDLAHDAGAAAYRRLEEGFSRLGMPVYVLPGNHDDRRLMARHLNTDRVRHTPAARHGRWLFVFLDSQVEGRVHGHLDGHQFDRVARTLEASNAPHVLLFVHHPPVPVGSRWLDASRIDNGEALLSLVHMEPRLRGVVFGHIHQTSNRLFDGRPLLGTPSTCFQFLPGAEEFALDDRPPGYRWLKLFDDGSLATGVEWLEQEVKLS